MSVNCTVTCVRRYFSKSVYSGLLCMRTVMNSDPSLGFYLHSYLTRGEINYSKRLEGFTEKLL